MSSLSSSNPGDYRFDKKCSNSSPQSGLMRSSGTSMSAPVIAGAALLVRQYYMEFNPVTGIKDMKNSPLADGLGPSAALLKATLVCSTP